jgi:hypothetical protein
MAWEGFRQGITDYRYLVTLEQRVNRALAVPRLAGAAARSRDKVRGALGSLTVLSSVRGAAQWQEQDDLTSNRPTVAGGLRLPVGWDLQRYDDMRREVAKEILLLDGLLRDGAAG